MTDTKYWPAGDSPSGLSEAAAALAAGGVVAFPTETVYGLGGDARSSGAVRRIFEAKGRPSDNPLIVHLASADDVHALVEGINEIERKLIQTFWPGPLTLVLPVKPGAVSPLVTAGLDTVAVRVPAHPVARDLIRSSGCPLAAPSANRSGRPSPTTALHVMEDLQGRIDGIVDGGAAGIGLESTVVRVLGGVIHVLRPGGVTAAQLQEAAGTAGRVTDEPGDAIECPVTVDTASTAPSGPTADFAELSEDAFRPRSPGVKYKHYAPVGEMLLVTGDDDERMIAAIIERCAAERRHGRRTGIIACAEHAGRYEGSADVLLLCGSRASPESAARQLYATLRECDERGLAFIAAEGFPEAGIGAALMNRLRKAAGGRILTT